MTARAWSCQGCGALVQPSEATCHRCGTLRYANAPPEELPPAGTPAEFVAAVHRTAVGPARPEHGPLPDTLPAETELVKSGGPGTVPEIPIAVPPPKPVQNASVAPSKPKKSRRWLWLLLVPILLGGGGYVAYLQVDAFQEYVDGMIDAARR